MTGPVATATVPYISLDRLLQVDTIYVEPAAAELERGRQVLARFPGAELVEVASHWQIPELHGNPGAFRIGTGSSEPISCWAR
jgi:hypothetical protein